MQTIPIRCPDCSHVLGIRQADGRVRIQHRGRWSVGPCPDEIGCECCPGVWRRETSEDRGHVPVLVAAR